MVALQLLSVVVSGTGMVVGALYLARHPAPTRDQRFTRGRTLAFAVLLCGAILLIAVSLSKLM